MQQLLTTFGETRRSRRRQALLGTARLVAVALAIAGGALASYQIGRSQSGIERSRFEFGPVRAAGAEPAPERAGGERGAAGRGRDHPGGPAAAVLRRRRPAGADQGAARPAAAAPEGRDTGGAPGVPAARGAGGAQVRPAERDQAPPGPHLGDAHAGGDGRLRQEPDHGLGRGRAAAQAGRPHRPDLRPAAARHAAPRCASAATSPRPRAGSRSRTPWCWAIASSASR